MPKKAPDRDFVTGEPIDPQGIVFHVEATAHLLPVKYLQSDGVISPPVTLHRSARRGGTEGIGLAYSTLMERYLEMGEKAALRHDRYEDMMWWVGDGDDHYGVDYVRRRLLERFPAYAALHILEVITTMHDERADPADIADRYKHTVGWVVRRFHLCNDMAAAHRPTCKCTRCQRRVSRTHGRLRTRSIA